MCQRFNYQCFNFIYRTFYFLPLFLPAVSGQNLEFLIHQSFNFQYQRIVYILAYLYSDVYNATLQYCHWNATRAAEENNKAEHKYDNI